ncbi:MAG: hypothetical protein U1C72_00265, partial [Candidatus Pacearchaeota archaeon]|nr:hypothetical protein [Candidatus Pacearchaeota archaeon]
MRRIRTVFKRFSAEFRGARLFGKHGLLRRSPIVPEIAAGLVLVLLIASAGATGVLNRVSLSSYPDFFAENAEFSVLEIPPSDAGLDKNVSNEVFSVIGPSILSQDVQSLIPTILLHYRIKYVTFYDTAFVSFFEPFLSPRAGDTETPRIDKVDGAKLSREREKSFLSIGDGWYRNEKGDSGVYRWIERSATLHFFIPQGGLSEAPTILAFSSQHQPGDGDLDILLNKEKIATVSFSNTYSDMYVELKGLQEGDNVITLTSVDTCSVAGGGDPRCLS